MNISRKQLHTIKQAKNIQDKILSSTEQMKKGFALMGASVLVSTIAAPIQANAKENDSANQTTTKTYSDNAFLNTIIPSASSIAAKNDLYASVMLAQAILESGWGTSSLASEPNYYSGAWKSNASTYEDATAYLTGRYATDSAYNTKLNRIIEAHGLAEYDSPTTATPTTPKPAEPAGQTGTSYTVKSGDTLYRIALSNGTTVANLTTWNSLKSESIYPGMTLIVSKTTSQPVETAPTTPTVTNPAVNTSSYTVKSGDTLWSISQKYKVTIAQVKSWNNLKTDFLQVGQKLVVSTTPTAKTITVVNGDTLYKIATKAGMSLAELKSVNNLTSDVIYPGQILYTTKETSTVVKEQPVQQTKPNPSVSTKTITVKSGDTLYRIALSNGTTVANLTTWNSLKSESIYPGMTLIVSKTTSQPVETAPTTPTVTNPAVNTSSYTVKSGDTLWSISQKYKVTIAQVKSWNNLKTDFLQVGQKLVVSTTPTAKTITVVNGDTLYKIATKAGMSLAELKSVNNLTSDVIYPGQILYTTKETSTVVKEQPVQQTKPNPSVSTKTITVKSGDTLYRIALSNGTTVANLTTWNSLKSESIYPGMTLIVSKTTSQPVETAPTTPTVTNPAVNTSSYTVKSGDTLWSISQKYKVTIAQVKSWNNLKTDFLQVGQKLVVSTTPTAKTITVVNGDTLYKIATKAGMSLAELKSVNNLTSDVIYPGQILYTTKETSTVVKEQPVQQTKPNPSVSTKTITVKSGDTLYRIALSNGTTVANLTTWNSLKSESIYPGMTLIVSKTTSQPVETAPTTPTVTNPAVNTSSYTVKSGDTLWSISQKYKVTIAQVKSWNNLKTDFLQVGQKLVVSTSTTQTGQTNTGNTTTPSQTVTTPTAKTITVVNGDTLYKIATKAGMSLAELKSVNNLTSDVIYPGQILYTTKETSTVVKEQPVQQTKPNPSVSTKTITVKSGDTLYRLATSAGLSLAEFKSLNNLKSDMIYPGQVLVTSKTTVVVKEQEKPAQTTPVTNQSTYTVQKGDTLYAIATKAGASVSQIREWNKLASDLIFVGQSLTLVGKTAVVEPTQTIAPSGSYEVKRGDTLYSIAKSNGISLTRLLEINDVNSSTIYPGQLLKVK